jgi:hypothetical protein
MIISLSSREGKLTIEPDPAIVHVGDRVVFELKFERATWASALPQRLVRWAVYFRKGHPFQENPPYYFGGEREWSASGPATEPGTIDPGKAAEPGDYKYGVRIVDRETGGVISDDDPKLIVIR